MEVNILMEIGLDLFKRITLEYENKTPNENKRGVINCGDNDVPSVLFPISAKYAINLVFIEIGGILKQTHILFRILKHLWNQKIKGEDLTNTAFILYSPTMEEGQADADIRFQNKETIDASRDDFRASYSKIIYDALDCIISMINRPGNAARILDSMQAQESIGIVFLISSDLSEQLIDHYPFNQGHDNTKMHAYVISVKVTEESKQSFFDYIDNDFGLNDRVYNSKEETDKALATIHDDKKEKQNEDDSLLLSK